MMRRPPRSTPPDTLFPYTTRCRSGGCEAAGDRLARARRVGRAPAGRSHRRRKGPRLAARGAGCCRFMTDAGARDRMTGMRALATLTFLIAAMLAVPAQAACDAPEAAAMPPNTQPIVPGTADEPLTPTPLAALAADSPGRARFEAAADRRSTRLHAR